MPSALILYQYFHPDDVVSATHLTDLAAGLVSRGWQVTALPCNRSCRSDSVRYAKRSTHQGVSIRRIWRPAFPQSSAWGRLSNCVWMLAAWSLSTLKYKPNVLIIGTDPILSAAVAIPWKLIHPKTQTVHWCFDLYPEAAVADGLLKPGKALSFLRSLMRFSYKRFDLIAAIGDCMRERLMRYGSPAQLTALPPWALAEPSSPMDVDLPERVAVFGNSRIALMYSGNFGRAHSYSEVLSIARLVKNSGVKIAFSICGNRADEVRGAVTAEDSNVSFVPFASADRLKERLSAADIHIVSLRPEWTGSVVPSKFFGALAVGRPVLFVGSEKSHIAQIIKKYGLGWICSAGQEEEVARQLRELAAEPSPICKLREHCHRIYQTYFARELTLGKFDVELRNLLTDKAHEAVPFTC